MLSREDRQTRELERNKIAIWAEWDEHKIGRNQQKVCLYHGLKLLEPGFAPEFSPWKGDELTATLLQLATAPRGLTVVRRGLDLW